MLPALFIAHGMPTLVLEQNEYTDFLRTLSGRLPKPKAVVIVSAHWESPVQRISGAVNHETIHDFFGFPGELYEIEYPAKGDISIAMHIRELLEQEGIGCELDDVRGLDHGAWSVLKLMYPQADIPVVSLSVHPRLVAEEQFRIGQILTPLRERGVLLIGSGGTVHHVQKLRWDSLGVHSWAIAFDDWLAEKLETWDTEKLFRYDELAPYARDAVPTPEHFVPLLIAMGAADSGKKAKLLHRQYQYGSLSLSCWMFG